jgi:hypothetical protein
MNASTNDKQSSDRRRLHRKYLAFFTRVFDRSNGELLGHLANVTPGGARLVCQKPVVVGRDFQLNMDLSEAFFEILSGVRCPLRVVPARPGSRVFRRWLPISTHRALGYPDHRTNYRGVRHSRLMDGVDSSIVMLPGIMSTAGEHSLVH